MIVVVSLNNLLRSFHFIEPSCWNTVELLTDMTCWANNWQHRRSVIKVYNPVSFAVRSANQYYLISIQLLFNIYNCLDKLFSVVAALFLLYSRHRKSRVWTVAPQISIDYFDPQSYIYLFLIKNRWLCGCDTLMWCYPCCAKGI